MTFVLGQADEVWIRLLLFLLYTMTLLLLGSINVLSRILIPDFTCLYASVTVVLLISVHYNSTQAKYLIYISIFLAPFLDLHFTC